MPRRAREKSRTGVYHVMLRGVNKQDIFEEPEDYAMFLEMLKEVRTIDVEEGASVVTYRAVTIYAYCLMTNHVHILLREHETATDTVPVEKILGLTMKRLGRKYALFFNKKYGRVGTLFDDRYKSEVVEDENYFLNCFCYIHRNPVKAGMVDRVDDYEWSSWKEYAGVGAVCSTGVLLDRYSLENLHEVVSQDRDGGMMEMDERRPLRDADVKVLLLELTGDDTVAGFQRLDKARRREVAADLIDAGAMFKQVSRLTGMSYQQVRYACESRNGDGVD